MRLEHPPTLSSVAPYRNQPGKRALIPAVFAILYALAGSYVWQTIGDPYKQALVERDRLDASAGGLAERPARWRSLYFMVPSVGRLTSQRSILWTTHRMPRMPEGEGGEARGRLSCSRVISLWWLKDPMVLSHSCSESWGVCDEKRSERGIRVIRSLPPKRKSTATDRAHASIHLAGRRSGPARLLRSTRGPIFWPSEAAFSPSATANRRVTFGMGELRGIFF